MFTAPSILLRHKNSSVLSAIVIYYSMEIIFQKFNTYQQIKNPKVHDLELSQTIGSTLSFKNPS